VSRFSGAVLHPRSRSRSVDRGTLYVFDARVMFIFLVERIAFMAKMIIASWVCIDMMLLLCRGAIELGSRDAVEKWRAGHNGGQVVNHVTT
jgi:hypothetical protein